MTESGGPTEHAEQGDEKFYTMPVTNPSLNPANLPQHAPSGEQSGKTYHLGHVPGTVIVDKVELEALRAELAQAKQTERILWEELRRAGDALDLAQAQRDQYLEQRNQARKEVARLNREIAMFDRTTAYHATPQAEEEP